MSRGQDAPYVKDVLKLLDTKEPVKMATIYRGQSIGMSSGVMPPFPLAEHWIGYAISLSQSMNMLYELYGVVKAESILKGVELEAYAQANTNSTYILNRIRELIHKNR